MGPGWKVGRLAGIEIAIHPSWLVIAFLLTYSLAAARFPLEFRGWSTALYWAVAAATSALFFASVLAHELSHAIVARRFGLTVEGITLFIFGGVTTMSSDSRTAREEALIAVAGPATSIVIGLAFIGANLVVDQAQIGALLGWLGFINLLLGLFNLIPGFPMDGGRVLRAVIWRIRGDRLAATRNAALVGRFFAYGLIGLGVWVALSVDIFSGLWLALIGWFLSNAAEATAAQAGVERTLFGIRVRDALDSEPRSVSPNESVATLVNDHLLRGEERALLVRHEDGGLAGIVTLSDVRRLPRERWDDTRVTDIMTRYGELAVTRPEVPLLDALRVLQERDVGQLPVVDEDGRRPVGIVSRRGILRLLEARMKLGF